MSCCSCCRWRCACSPPGGSSDHAGIARRPRVGPPCSGVAGGRGCIPWTRRSRGTNVGPRGRRAVRTPPTHDRQARGRLDNHLDAVVPIRPLRVRRCRHRPDRGLPLLRVKRPKFLRLDGGWARRGDTNALGLSGQGGIGKSVLAAGLARDEQVRRHFPDGVFWVMVGERAGLGRRPAGPDERGQVAGGAPVHAGTAGIVAGRAAATRRQSWG
jgi:NB-ARC domain